jgi:hypothetical protein
LIPVCRAGLDDDADERERAGNFPPFFIVLCLN